MQCLVHVRLDALDEGGVLCRRVGLERPGARTASGRAGIPRWHRGPAPRRGPGGTGRCSRSSALRHACHSSGNSDSTLSRARTSSLRLVSCVERADKAHGHLRLALLDGAVQLLRRDAEAVRIAADLVERQQAVVDIKGRILQPLAMTGAVTCWNLPTKRRCSAWSSSLADAGYFSSSMSRTKSNSARLTAGFLRCGPGHRLLDVAAGRPGGCPPSDVGAVDGKAGDDLLQAHAAGC